LPSDLNGGMTEFLAAKADSTGDGLPWFALRVRSQRERNVATHLNAKGYELFLPLYACTKRWSDRTRKADQPLFPGYLFCRFDPGKRLPILKTPWLLQIVGHQTPVPIDHDEIGAIRSLVASGAAAEPCLYLGAGEKVRIRSGPLRGVVGVLTQFHGNRKLVVSVTLLQRSIAVEIDSALVAMEASAKEMAPVSA
jgi:transcription antitermination factor NusG